MRENVWNFVNFFWHGGQNCFLCVQRTFVHKEFSFSQNLQNFQLFSDFEGNILGFGFLAKITLLKIIFIYDFIKNCFFYEILEFRYCFSTVGRKIYNIGTETSEKLSKVHSTWTTELFEESMFPEENIYIYKFFEFWSKTLRISVGKCSARFEKLLSTPVQGIFLHNNILFLEKINAH